MRFSRWKRGKWRQAGSENPWDPIPKVSLCCTYVSIRKIRRANFHVADFAFSKAYVSTKQVVPVCEDVSFHVDTIHSGATLTLDPDGNKTRICSIAAGKVRVKTGGEPEFTIGPHGMFKIKPGVGCAVQNWMYIDAIIHITVLSGFV